MTDMLTKTLTSPEDIAEAVKSECDKNNIKYHETINRIYIKSDFLSDWFIDLDTMEVYHENYRRQKGYHRHELEGYGPRDIVRYIMAHDRKMLYRMGGRKRIDR